MPGKSKKYQWWTVLLSCVREGMKRKQGLRELQVPVRDTGAPVGGEGGMCLCWIVRLNCGHGRMRSRSPNERENWPTSLSVIVTREDWARPGDREYEGLFVFWWIV